MITTVNDLIQDLSRCIDRAKDAYPDCTDCPYFLKDPDCIVLLMIDALNCIVTLEDPVPPRVMDLAELREMPVGAVAWRETCWPAEEEGRFMYRLDPVMREKPDPLYYCADMMVAWNGYEDLDDPELLKVAEDGGQTVSGHQNRPTSNGGIRHGGHDIGIGTGTSS